MLLVHLKDSIKKEDRLPQLFIFGQKETRNGTIAA